MFKLIALLMLFSFVMGNLFNKYLLQKIIDWFKNKFGGK
jgi:hypothetical protein